MKKQTRLYNVILPIWLLFLFPVTWLIVIPGNLIIDCSVVLLALTALKHPQKKAVLKQVWWRVWLWGFAADFVGVALLILAMFSLSFLPDPWNGWLQPVTYNPFKSWLAFVFTSLAVAVSGVHIYFFNKLEVLPRTNLTDRERHIVALSLAIATAPWTFFIPLSW